MPTREGDAILEAPVQGVIDGLLPIVGDPDSGEATRDAEGVSVPEDEIVSGISVPVTDKEGDGDFGVGDVDAVIDGVGATVQRADPAAFVISVVPFAQGSVLKA